MPLAFAPLSWFPLAPLGLALLFDLLCRATTPRRAGWLGFLFGCGLMAVGVSWVQISIHQFGLPVYLFSVGVTIPFVLFLALYPALAGYCVARFRLRADGVGVLAFAALWTLTEWLRGWVLTGFPWLYLGYSQVESPLVGFAPLAGALGVSFAVAAIGALLAVAYRTTTARGRTQALGAIVAIVAAGALLQRIDYSDPAGEPLRVALVQGNVAQALKWEPEARGKTLAIYRELSEPHWGSDLILWPETAIPAFPEQVRDFLTEIGTRALDADTVLLAGMPTMPERALGYRNSVIAIAAEPGRYDKHHLVPFGEYLPLRPLLGPVLDFLAIPMSDFEAGDGAQEPIRVRGFPLGVSICYEDAYSSEIRRTQPQAALLVNVSNDAWFGDSLAPHQHLEIARMRAIELRRDLLRATNTGISAIIDAHGRIVTRAEQFTATAISGSAVPRQGATPFALMGDVPIVLAALLITGAAWRRRASAAAAPPR
ncbi:MAG: apolipoprotein N-acyltransferase [Gammaproteobacteria bacterium]|nr:apolipoprotein N-acyltransferase [Gammaproteobacteria bacterium]